MADHDEFCRYPTFPMTGPDACDCALIARVRVDERARTQGIIEELENHIDYLPGHTRAELRAVVETLPIILYPIPDEKWGAVTGHAVDRGDVLALLDGSNDEQG